MTLNQTVLLGLVAVAAICGGVFLVFGPGWALIVAGVLVLVGAVALYDPQSGFEADREQ